MKKSYVYLKQHNDYSIHITEIIKFVLGAFFGVFAFVFGFLSLWVIFPL